MFIRHLEDCDEITAGDGTTLRELLHPDRQDVPIRYSIAHARLAPGGASKPHRMRTSEVYVILSGSGAMHVDEETSAVQVGDAIAIPSNSQQWIRNTGMDDLTFLCIVDPAWRKENETLA